MTCDYQKHVIAKDGQMYVAPDVTRCYLLPNSNPNECQLYCEHGKVADYYADNTASFNDNPHLFSNNYITSLP